MNLSIGLFPMLWLNISLEDRSRRNLYVFPMVVISMLILLLIYFKQQEVLEEEIKSYGLTTYGKVIGFEVGFGRSRTKYATFTYTFENKQYIHRIKNYNKQYHLNQSLTLLISKRNPEIFKIMGTNE
jgi:hypothetical protein